MTRDVETQVINGWRFPANLDIPGEDSGSWTRVKKGDSTFFVVGHDILIDAAHQAGLNGIDTEIAHIGTGLNDIPHVAVKATVDIEGCPDVTSFGSIDETANSLEDMVSTAETRAVKRSIKRALGITNPGVGAEDPDAAGETTKTRQGGEISRDEDGEVDGIDPPDDYDSGRSPTDASTSDGDGTGGFDI